MGKFGHGNGKSGQGTRVGVKGSGRGESKEGCGDHLQTQSEKMTREQGRMEFRRGGGSAAGEISFSCTERLSQRFFIRIAKTENSNLAQKEGVVT